MDTKRILTELLAERDKLDAAISALEAVGTASAREPGRSAVAGVGGGRRRLSAAARNKLSRLLKERWAKGKMRSGAKAVSRSPRRISRAGRARIAAAQRARWARVRAQRSQNQAA